MAILIDSSVWIAALNSKNPECKKLQQLISSDELIYVSCVIQAEVCQGAKSEEIFKRMSDAFLGFEFLPIEDRHWKLSAWNYFRCRKKGFKVTTVDCLIATMGHEYRVPIWTLDRHFEKIQPVLGFELYQRS